MTPILDQIIRLLATPQGSILFYVVLGLSCFGALQASLYIGELEHSSEGKRLQQGLLFLVLIQFLLFLVAWMGWLGAFDPRRYLPVLDTALGLFSLVLVLWLWIFPRQDRRVETLVIVIEAAIVVAGIIAMLWWLQQAGAVYLLNTMVGAYAYYLGLGLLVVGVILLLIRRPASWVYGLVMLVIVLLGYLAQYFIPQMAADYAWFVRLGEMIGFPMLLALPRRVVIPTQVSTRNGAAPLTGMGADSLTGVLDLTSEPNAQVYYQKLTGFLAEWMDAGQCLLVMAPQSGSQMILPLGYDRVVGRPIEGLTLDGNQFPVLLGALRASNVMRIADVPPEAEATRLAEELGQKDAQQFLLAPFTPQGASNELFTLLSSKPGVIGWTSEDESRLQAINLLLFSRSRLFTPAAGASVAGTGSAGTLRQVQDENASLRKEYADLKNRFDALVSKATAATLLIDNRTAEQTSLKELREVAQKMESRNRELELQLQREKPYLEEVEQLRAELRSALTDIARIPTTLSRSDQKMLQVQLSAVKHLEDVEATGLVSSIAQDIRQPLSSIIGYTDLMLGETVGLVGAMQRKFLERIKAAAEKMHILLNELVQVIAIDGGRLEQQATQVDLNSAVDEAVGNIIAQISEKNIALRVDLPAKLPPVQVDKDALQQILANLLQNACTVTPEDGEIRLLGRLERRDQEPDYILIAMTDQGGGIARADLPRVFSRRYKVDNPLIQGVGDTGVGLSIVKSLVELQKGRVWVDSHEGAGATFTVLLPVAAAEPFEVNPQVSPSG